MAKAISWEIREEAKGVYVVDGKTFEEVAKITGVSVGQLKRWGKDEDWTGARKEYRESIVSIKRDTVLLRKRMARRALDSLDPQDLYAMVRLEAMAGRQDKKEEKTIEADRPSLFLEAMEFIAKTMEEIDPEGLKVFAKNFDVIIARFKEQHAETS